MRRATMARCGEWMRTNAADPEGHLAAATLFGTIGYFVYNGEQRQ